MNFKTINEIKIPFVDLSISDQDSCFPKFHRAILAVLHSGKYIMGERLEAFEKKLCKAVGCRFGVGVNSGTDALFLVMRALNIGVGDEVIIPANSFYAVANAVCNTGAQPVFCDVIYENMLIDTNKIEQLITRKTKAIIPVHLTGMPCDMDEINNIAMHYGVFVIEDAAQAIGAQYKGRQAGSLSTAGCFSLHPLKNVHVLGDGGAVVTNDPYLYERISEFRNHGLKGNRVVQPGYNSRLDEIHAAFAAIQLDELEEITSKKRAIAASYMQGLEGFVNLNLEPKYKRGVYQLFMIKTEQRDNLANNLKQIGIETRVHYRFYIPFHPYYRQCFCSNYKLPVTERLSKEVLSLPIYTTLTDEKINFIISAIRKFFQ
jgi:dTDP-4-amino-4,6-dideoxygalactose transaminase